VNLCILNYVFFCAKKGNEFLCFHFIVFIFFY
jgi:hypothetical protein